MRVEGSGSTDPVELPLKSWKVLARGCFCPRCGELGLLPRWPSLLPEWPPTAGRTGRDELPAPLREEPGGLGGLRVLARVGAVLGRLVAAVGCVSRLVGPASSRGWPSEWEDVVAVAAGRGPGVRGPSAWRVVAVAIMVETVFVGGCPSG